MAYKVKLNIFEGPFELLVYLIEHARMSVYDIQVSEITRQYMEYVRALEESDVEVAQEFMVLAAELIEIKSRMLLPVSANENQDGEAEDPRASLVARLLEYKLYKEAAAFLAEQAEVTEHIHTKPQEDLSLWTDDPDEILVGTNEQLAAAFRAFLLRRQKMDEMKRTYERVERERATVEIRIDQIRHMFKDRSSMMFSEMIKEDSSPFNRVVTFMSLLEMVKGSELDAEQKKRYGDIKISLTKAGENHD